ncbi:MAG: TIGR01777 family oxidoreductase [Desulfobaccales bacterium]|nr:TIGR01777 family oxidoreductase [Desulfobaccales bacterium]
MKIFMTGGSGFVGTFLSRQLAQKGHEVTILSRSERAPAPTPTGISFLTGNPAQEGPWMAAVSEHDWIINLAGASVFGRWDARTKQNIYDSRILTTRNLIKALAGGDRHQLFCSTSAVGYYGLRGEETLTEESAPGTDFLAKLAQDWEAEALKAQDLGVRVVITRFGLVLGKNGGVLDQLVPLFKKFLGGPVGSGKQWFSWIHQEDHARAFLFLKDHPEITGPVNLTAPNPVRNRELARALGKALHRPNFLPAPAFMVRLLLGEFGQVVLEGQKVLPQKLLTAGFTFLYPTIDQALSHLLGEEG